MIIGNYNFKNTSKLTSEELLNYKGSVKCKKLRKQQQWRLESAEWTVNETVNSNRTTNL